jgi:hypothetical protein
VNIKPRKEVDETWWPTANAALTPAAEEGFRGLVLEAVEATVTEAYQH